MRVDDYSEPRKIGHKSVDSVENAGVKHAAPVDNPARRVVAPRAPLLQSAPFAGGHFPTKFLENPQVNDGLWCCLVVVRRDPALTAEALLDYCRKTLSAYKVPKYVVFRDAPLPKSNIGKVLRRVVVEEEAQRSAGRVAAG